MKLLVCLSKVPDTTTKITFAEEGKRFDENGVTFILNPYDEWYALVRALELKEAHGGTVTVIHVGPSANDAVIRKGLAIGADDAVRIDATQSSSLFIAKQISAFVEAEKGYDIIFTGKETINYNRSEVGAMIAEYLDQPFISFANHLEINGSTATLDREIDGGTEVVEVETPFVVSAAKGMAEQRIPNMKGIMMANKKPIKVVPPVPFDEIAVPVFYELPPAKSGVKLIDADNIEELVRLLHEEAKVI
ncbi:MAG: electron transfer flavoprotein subunit beta/FixA family protein [Saprospiraceae bacterium]|nr:electron transfer flavoprotein subunit beta/FixA family protein [Saprospiraceae bacterium]